VLVVLVVAFGDDMPLPHLVHLATEHKAVVVDALVPLPGGDCGANRPPAGSGSVHRLVSQEVKSLRDLNLGPSPVPICPKSADNFATRGGQVCTEKDSKHGKQLKETWW
jgi:hypothetical protein